MTSVTIVPYESDITIREKECLICCDNNGKLLYKVCNCDTYIHLECFEKMINTVSSHNTHCAVCKQKYYIKSRLNGFFISDFKNFFILFLFDLLTIIVLVLISYMIYAFRTINRESHIILVSMLSLLGFTVIMGWFFVRYLYYIRRKRLCCIEPVWKRSAIIFEKRKSGIDC